MTPAPVSRLAYRRACVLAGLALACAALATDLGLRAIGLPAHLPFDALLLSGLWLIVGLALGPLLRDGFLSGHGLVIVTLALVSVIAGLILGAEHLTWPEGLTADRTHLLLERVLILSPVYPLVLLRLCR